MAEAFPEVSLLFNWLEGGKTPSLSLERLKELGLRLILFPLGMLLASAQAVREALAQMRADGTPAPIMDSLPPFEEFTDLIGLAEIRKLEERFAEEEVQNPRQQDRPRADEAPVD